MKIKLKPCYPPVTDFAQQLKKIKSEYEELMEAIKNESWQDQAKESLDVAQTIQGIIDIDRDGFVTCVIEGDYVDRHLLQTIKSFWMYREREIMCLSDLYKLSIRYFYLLICRHDRNNEKYRYELIDRFLSEHQEKLRQRKEEWDCENVTSE